MSRSERESRTGNGRRQQRPRGGTGSSGRPSPEANDELWLHRSRRRGFALVRTVREGAEAARRTSATGTLSEVSKFFTQ